jgi:hypothetical protein
LILRNYEQILKQLLDKLSDSLPDCMGIDRNDFSKRLKQIGSQPVKKRQRALETLTSDIENSMARKQARRDNRLVNDVRISPIELRIIRWLLFVVKPGREKRPRYPNCVCKWGEG